MGSGGSRTGKEKISSRSWFPVKSKPPPDPAGSSGVENMPQDLSQFKAKELGFHTYAPVVGKRFPGTLHMQENWTALPKKIKVTGLGQQK